MKCSELLKRYSYLLSDQLRRRRANYETISEKLEEGSVEIETEDSHNCELERLGRKQAFDHTIDLLSREQRAKIEELLNDPNVTDRKADKSNVLVILNNSYCR